MVESPVFAANDCKPADKALNRRRPDYFWEDSSLPMYDGAMAGSGG